MNTANTKERTITVKKKDVFLDIDYLSLNYAEGEADVVRANSISTETDDATGVRVITRLCDHRVSDLKQILKKFIKSVTSSSTNNTYSSSDWVFNIVISTEAEDNIFPSLCDLFHDYIVSGALADYYAQVGKTGNIESLRLRCDNDIARIRELIYFRPMP